MAEINKDELARIVGLDDDAEKFKRTARIIKDNKQYSVRIPIKFAEEANIDPKKDTFEFTLEPIEDSEGKFRFHIYAELKRG
jgi:hypothetical protein